MAAPFPFDIDVRGVGAIQIVHYLAEISFRCLDQQMIVVGHEDIAVQDKAEFCLPVTKVFLEFPVVGLAEKNFAPLVAAGGYMIKCAFIFDAERPGRNTYLLCSSEGSILSNLSRVKG